MADQSHREEVARTLLAELDALRREFPEMGEPIVEPTVEEAIHGLAERISYLGKRIDRIELALRTIYDPEWYDSMRELAGPHLRLVSDPDSVSDPESKEPT